MVAYADACAMVFARGTVPDGYFGDRRSAGFAFAPDSGRVLIVADCGCYNSGLPPAVDQDEALWLLRNHPTARNITVTQVAA